MATGLKMKILFATANLILICANLAFADPGGNPDWSVTNDGAGKTQATLYGSLTIWQPGSGICLPDGTTIFSGVQFPTTGQFNTLQVQLQNVQISTGAILAALTAEKNTRSTGTWDNENAQVGTATNANNLSGSPPSYYGTAAQITTLGISSGSIYVALQSTSAFLSILSNNFNSFQNAVNISTASQALINTATALTDSNQNTAIGVLQNNLFAYGGQQLLSVNFSTGTSFVNVDTTTYAPGIGFTNTIYNNTSIASTYYSGPAQYYGSNLFNRQSFVANFNGLLESVSFYMQDQRISGYTTVNLCDNNMIVLTTTTLNMANYVNSMTWQNVHIGYNIIAGSTYYILVSSDSNIPNNLLFGISDNSYTQGMASYSGDKITWYNRTLGELCFILNISTPNTGSYSTVFSSASLNIFNNGGFYTWGKFACADNQSTVTGSSITYTVAFSTNGVNTFTAPQTITNGALLTANTPYMQYNEYFNRWVSTATPITNSASFNINYSPSLIGLSANNVWVGSNTFTAPVTISSLTVTSESFSNGTTQTTAYTKYISTSCFSFSMASSGIVWTTITGSTLTYTCDGNTYLEYIIDAQGSNTGSLCDNGVRLYMDNVLQWTQYVDVNSPSIVYSNLSRSGLLSSKPSAGSHNFYLQLFSSTGVCTISGRYTLRPSY